MRPETLTALQQSVTHWEDNLELTKKDLPIKYGAKDCSLCQLFPSFCTRIPNMVGSDYLPAEELCPVFERTGYDSCDRSPYYNVLTTWEEEYPLENLVIAIQTEIDFLKSLLPKGED